MNQGVRLLGLLGSVNPSEGLPRRPGWRAGEGGPDGCSGQGWGEGVGHMGQTGQAREQGGQADLETRSGPAGFHCRGTVTAPATDRSLISSDFSASTDNMLPLHSCSPPSKSTRCSQVVLLDKRPHDPGVPLA